MSETGEPLGQFVEKEIVHGDVEASVIEPIYSYEIHIVAVDGNEEYTIDRTVVTWSISHAKTLLLIKDEKESLIMTAKAWKTVEVTRNDYNKAENEDYTKKRRVDSDAGSTDFFDFIQIDNETGIIQGIDGTPEVAKRIVTYNPQYFDFLVVGNQ